MSAEFIHRFVKGASASTLVALHGTGGDENDLIGVAHALAPSASVLSPRGKVMEGTAARFFSRKAGYVFDPEEIRERAAELAEWLGFAAQEYQLDGSRMFALGYSNGANIAAALMMLHPGAITGAVLLRPMKVIDVDPVPNLEHAPVLIEAGNADTVLPPGSSQELARQLAQAGARVDLTIQNAGHDLTPQDFAIAKQWLAAVLQSHQP